MLDLSAGATAAWLKSAEPSLVEEPLALPHIRHSPQLEETLAHLGDVLSTADADIPDNLYAYLQTGPSIAALRMVMLHLDRARMLRLLHWLASPTQPRRQAILTALLAEDGGPQAKRLTTLLRVIGRVSLINSLFATNRIDSLHAACQSHAAEAL